MPHPGSEFPFIYEGMLPPAQVITAHIANMDLEPLKEMQANTPHASLLEKALFQVVANLDLYRPYLPDTLFINNNGGRGGDSGSLPSTSFRADKQKEELHVYASAMLLFILFSFYQRTDRPTDQLTECMPISPVDY